VRPTWGGGMTTMTAGLAGEDAARLLAQGGRREEAAALMTEALAG
jgi:hypothetical protein